MNESKICPPPKKICPLLSAADLDSLAYCQGERCAWYVPFPYEGRCAIQMLGTAAPELVQVVRSV